MSDEAPTVVEPQRRALIVFHPPMVLRTFSAVLSALAPDYPAAEMDGNVVYVTDGEPGVEVYPPQMVEMWRQHSMLLNQLAWKIAWAER